MTKMTVEFDLPKWPVGTTFEYLSGKKSVHQATVLGYYCGYYSDTNEQSCTYVISYEFAGQTIRTTVPRATVDRAMIREDS